jgi:tetratricopeptide (TPR) repeat protein
LGLLGLFFYLGGIARLSNHFAADAIAQRDWQRAGSWLHVSQRWAPRNPARHFWSARLARHQGNLPQMRRDLERALALGFDPARVRREQILAAAQAGRLSEVEAEINRWLRAGDPEVPEISAAYANGLASNSRFHTALQVLQAWHDDYPDDPVPLYRRGRIQEHSDRVEEAVASYREAIAVDPEYLPPYYSLGRLLLADKKPDEALPLFERCLAAPETAAAKVGIARCLIDLGEAEQATALLYEVMETDPAAIRASYQAVGETPERFVAAAELGKQKANAGEFAEAKRLLDRAIEENPRDLAARYSRAVALRGLGRQAEAEEEFAYVQRVQDALAEVKGYQDRISRTPEDTEARIAMGKLLLQYESERAGLFWLRSVLVYDGDNRAAHAALADYYEAHADESAAYAELAREHRRQAE